MPVSTHQPVRSALPTVLLFLVFLIAGVFLVWRFWPSLERTIGLGKDGGGGDPTAAPRVITPAGPLGAEEKATIELYNKSKDSVVNVTTSKVYGSRPSLHPHEVPQGS